MNGTDAGKIGVTIAICTRNRAEQLGHTLASLCAMRIPENTEWELVVVNNASTDNTPAIIDSFAQKLPIRQAFEEKIGVSNARNRAVNLARGAYIVWTDDDVVVHPDLLSAYVSGFRLRPEATLFGGKVVARFEVPPPDWLTRSLPVMESVYAIRDFGSSMTELTLEGDRIPYGTNYALRTDAHRTYPFRTDLGPGTGMNGEETEVIRSVLRSGAQGYWIPDALIYHCIPRERMRIAYIDRYFLNYGRFLAYTERNRSSRKIFGSPRWLWRRLATDMARYAACRVAAQPEDWMKARIARQITRGMVRYYRNEDIRHV